MPKNLRNFAKINYIKNINYTSTKFTLNLGICDNTKIKENLFAHTHTCAHTHIHKLLVEILLL